MSKRCEDHYKKKIEILKDQTNKQKFLLLYRDLLNRITSLQVKERLWKAQKDSEESVRKGLSQYFAYVEELGDFYTEAQHVNADQVTVPVCVFVSVCLPSYPFCNMYQGLCIKFLFFNILKGF